MVEWIGHNDKDGGLDLVCYRDFMDEREGMPMYFLQCASGKNKNLAKLPCRDFEVSAILMTLWHLVRQTSWEVSPLTHIFTCSTIARNMARI